MYNSENSALFTFDIPFLTENYYHEQPALRVLSFSGEERVSAPYLFTIEVACEDRALPLRNLLGQRALFTLYGDKSPARYVHGAVRKFTQMETGGRFTRYQCELVPQLWFLSQTRDHRIFQHKTVAEIISQILQKHQFTRNDFEFYIWKALPRREYCVQYGESDLYFISRLLEEEGIRYYFRHSEQNHVLCMSNAPGVPDVVSESGDGKTLEYLSGTGLNPDYPVIRNLSFQEQINSGSATYREWNFTRPRLNLEKHKRVELSADGDIASWEGLEVYEYPHLYQWQHQGEHYVELQLERIQCWNKWIEGNTESRSLIPGHGFRVAEHSHESLNRDWQIIEVIQSGRQPQSLEEGASGGSGDYSVSFIGLPDDIIYRPALEHPKQKIVGDQTALVTGPQGEEIYVDNHGRVKVQFFWDREGQMDEKTTCWVRVSQGWAGGQYGTMSIPRIAQEVIVSFLEGNPDRPLITGRVYHGLNLPPYELPLHMTRTVFKSYSSPGGDGYNELRIEDKKGEEEIYMHAEKDVNVYVKNDRKEHILRDRHSTVDRDRYEHVVSKDNLIVDKDSMVELKKNSHATVAHDIHEKVGSRSLVFSGNEMHFNAGQKITVEAGTEMTLKAGGAFIRLSPAGIMIDGQPAKVNAGGSPGSGSGASPALPTEALPVGKAAVPDGVEHVEITALEAPVRGNVGGTVGPEQFPLLYQAQELSLPFCGICSQVQEGTVAGGSAVGAAVPGVAPQGAAKAGAPQANKKEEKKKKPVIVMGLLKGYGSSDSKKFDGGQVIQVEVKNLGPFGGGVYVRTNHMQSKPLWLFAGESDILEFSVFGEVPIYWEVDLRYQSGDGSTFLYFIRSDTYE